MPQRNNGDAALGSQAQQGERLRRIGWLDPAPETDPNVQVRKTVVQQSFQSRVGRSVAISRLTIGGVSLTLSGLGELARNL